MMIIIEDWGSGSKSPYRLSVFTAEPAFRGIRYSLEAALHSSEVIGHVLFEHEGSHRLSDHFLGPVTEHVSHPLINKGGHGILSNRPYAFVGGVDDPTIPQLTVS